MPEAKNSELQIAARASGFKATRQKGQSSALVTPDGRATTIPIHAATISGPLYYAILKQLGISEADFKKLK